MGRCGDEQGRTPSVWRQHGRGCLLTPTCSSPQRPPSTSTSWDGATLARPGMVPALHAPRPPPSGFYLGRRRSARPPRMVPLGWSPTLPAPPHPPSTSRDGAPPPCSPPHRPIRPPRPGMVPYLGFHVLGALGFHVLGWCPTLLVAAPPHPPSTSKKSSQALTSMAGVMLAIAVFSCSKEFQSQVELGGGKMMLAIAVFSCSKEFQSQTGGRKTPLLLLEGKQLDRRLRLEGGLMRCERVPGGAGEDLGVSVCRSSGSWMPFRGGVHVGTCPESPSRQAWAFSGNPLLAKPGTSRATPSSPSLGLLGQPPPRQAWDFSDNPLPASPCPSSDNLLPASPCPSSDNLLPASPPAQPLQQSRMSQPPSRLPSYTAPFPPGLRHLRHVVSPLFNRGGTTCRRCWTRHIPAEQTVSYGTSFPPSLGLSKICKKCNTSCRNESGGPSNMRNNETL